MTRNTVLLLLVIVCLNTAFPSGSGDDVELCEKRPKYIYTTLDTVIADTVELIVKSACDTVEADPFDAVFTCFNRISDLPEIQLEWAYRTNVPRVIGLKDFLCMYNLEASRCHDYREGINEYFTCPQGYENQMERVVAQMVEKTHEVFCEGAGTAMIMFAAADGDACLNQGRTSLLKCMYKALPTLKHISSNQMGVNSTLPIGPTCKVLEVVRRCSFHHYSKCSTSIPAQAVDHLLQEFGRTLSCPFSKQRIGRSKNGSAKNRKLFGKIAFNN